MNTTDGTPLARRLIVAFARWAYWPADPRQRAPLYLTALALLAVACADQTTRASSGPAAFLIYWPVAVFLITPIVRAAQIALTTPLYRGQRPRGLRLVPRRSICPLLPFSLVSPSHTQSLQEHTHRPATI